jgi:hypothetical protein
MAATNSSSLTGLVMKRAAPSLAASASSAGLVYVAV